MKNTPESTSFDGGQEMSMWMTLMHEAMAAKLGLNATDLKALSLLRRQPSLGPSELAVHMGLTRGSVTTLLDRLERKRFIRRSRHQADGRQVRLELRAERQPEIAALYSSLGGRMAALYGTYTPAQLRFIQHFMEGLTAVCRAEIEALQKERPQGA